MASFKDHTSVYMCFYTIAVVVVLIPIAGFCFIVVVRIKFCSKLVMCIKKIEISSSHG